MNDKNETDRSQEDSVQNAATLLAPDEGLPALQMRDSCQHFSAGLESWALPDRIVAAVVAAAAYPTNPNRR